MICAKCEKGFFPEKAIACINKKLIRTLIRLPKSIEPEYFAVSKLDVQISFRVHTHQNFNF